MNYIDLGTWGAPDRVAAPEGSPYGSYAAWKNDAGEDWYAKVAHAASSPDCFAVVLNEAGAVRGHVENARFADPTNSRVVALPDWDGTEEDKDALFGQLFDLSTGTFKAPPPAVPAVISKAQAQLALYGAGILDQLEAIIAAHPYRPVRIWYESANSWERKNPYVNLLGPELNLSEAQIDALFVEAGRL
jgi:hypothetical protein